MLKTALKGALIDAAVVIFLGQHLPVLRRKRRGQKGDQTEGQAAVQHGRKFPISLSGIWPEVTGDRGQRQRVCKRGTPVWADPAHPVLRVSSAHGGFAPGPIC